MSENVLNTICVNGPDVSDKYGGVILEITDGKRVMLQLKSDGTLLLSGVHVQTVAEITSCQTPIDFDETGGSPITVIYE